MMKLTLLVTLLAVLVGCGPSREDQQREAMQDAADQMEEAANNGDAAGAFGSAMGQMAGNQEHADPVDFRRLKELLPEEAAGLRRTSANGERSGAMGMTVSKAEADYEGDGGATAHVAITDMAGVPFAAMMGAAWAAADVDRESDTGYERTTTFEGQRAHEQVDNASQHAQLDVLVANRFLVEASGYQMDMDRVKDLVRALDLRALEGMRDEGK